MSCGSGYGWTSPVLPKLETPAGPENPLPSPATKSEQSWITALLHLGAAIGPIAAGVCAKTLGRKRTLLIFSLTFILSNLMLAFGKNVIVYLIARFILGLGIGCTFTVIPMYVGEISENKNRGTLSCLFPFMMCIGMFICTCVGPYTSVLVISLISAIPSVLFLLLFGFLSPETPHHLIYINKEDAAKEALEKLRLRGANIQKDLLEIKEDVEKYRDMQGGIKELLKSREAIKGLIICVGAVFFEQFAGITAVVAYLQQIFAASGTKIPSDLSAISIGVVQLIMMLVAIELVDRLGRKILFIFSGSVSSVSLVGLGIFFYLRSHGKDVESLFWLPITSLIVYQIAFGIGLAPLPFTVAGEIFPNNLKSFCCTVTAFMCHILAFLIAAVFSDLTDALGMAGTFWFFAVFAAISVGFFAILLPETKGKSLEEIQVLLGKKS